MSIKDIAQGKTKRALGSGGDGDTSDSPVVKPEVGEELAGRYVGSSTYPSKYAAADGSKKDVHYYRFEAPDGSKFTLRSHGDLADSMGEAEEGMLLCIERGPDKKTKSGFNFAQYFVSELV